ncbi:MAG: hypothetical protein HYV63_15225 [Candidatus Schekmanbacteria bacterium]|nr:hypothetical protein [Candidatus Schekmanbacteria bacterium]
MSDDLIRYDTSKSRSLGKKAVILAGGGIVGMLISSWLGAALFGASAFFGFRWLITSMAERGKRL